MIVCFVSILALLLLARHEKYPQRHVMADEILSSNIQPVDPKAPLPPEDLVKLLMQYCNDRVRENVGDTRNLRRV